MEFKHKVCLYEAESNSRLRDFYNHNLKYFNFDSRLVDGDIQTLFKNMSENKTDIVVLNLLGFDNEKIKYVLNMIYNNFCKNILLVLDYDIDLDIEANKLIVLDNNNFELKLGVKLMDIKRDIESYPSRNILLLRNKISNMLEDFQFSTRHDGFKYYIDAILFAYMKLPDSYHTMKVYKLIAEKYGKTIFAVEKSMRVALMFAFNKLKSAPSTSEFDELRTHLTYDLNNNTAISMLLNRLIKDEEIKEDLINKKEFLVMR